MKKLAAILLMILALAAGKLCALAMGQGQSPAGTQQTFMPSPGSPRPTFKAGWRVCKPKRPVDPRLGVVLGDIESHLAESVEAKYGPDRAHWAHEATHIINNRFAYEVGPGVVTYYCLKDRAAAFGNPPIDKRQVEALVPQDMHGQWTWKLYMTGLNPETPMVIIDEWIAYINGAQASAEAYGNASHTPQNHVLFDREAAVEFCAYATALLQAIDRYAPQYPDRDELAEFIAWNMERTFALTKYHPSAAKVEVFQRRYFAAPQSQCYGDDCTPTFNGQQWVPSQQPAVPYVPGPAPPPITKPAQPPTVPVKPRPPGLVKGDKGDVGPVGPAGPQGPVGPQGKAADPVDVSAIAREVIKNLPPQPAPQVDVEAIVVAVLSKVNQCKCQPPAEGPKQPEPQSGIFYDLRPHQPQR